MDHVSIFISTVEPSVFIKSSIKLIHMIGIAVGLGAATVLDIVILRFLVLGDIKEEHVKLVEFVAGIVTLGLCLLWLSGFSYLLHYASFNPENLANQKVWAKIAIVATLTINGYFIHHNVLPLIRKQIGGGLFNGLTRRQGGVMLVFGTISATSWYVPLMLGATPYLNFVVPASAILLAYALVLLFGIASTQGLAHLLWKDQPTREAEAEYQALMGRVATTVKRGMQAQGGDGKV